MHGTVFEPAGALERRSQICMNAPGKLHELESPFPDVIARVGRPLGNIKPLFEPCLESWPPGCRTFGQSADWLRSGRRPVSHFSTASAPRIVNRKRQRSPTCSIRPPLRSTRLREGVPSLSRSWIRTSCVAARHQSGVAGRWRLRSAA
jgi:hypothetical protein